MSGYCSDGEPVTCYTSKRPKARVQHKCGDCGEAIPPGQHYIWEQFMWEGRWQVLRTCLACQDVFVYLWDADAECLHHGGLRDYVLELSPHDFLPGGDYADCPRRPFMDEWLKEWTDDTPTPAPEQPR